MPNQSEIDNEAKKKESRELQKRFKTALFWYVLNLLEQKNSNPEVVAAIPELLKMII